DLDTLVAGTSDVLAGVFESLATAIGDEDGSTGDEGSLLDIELEPVELASELSTRTGLDVVVEDPVHLVVTDLTSDDGDGDDGSGLGRENLLRNVTRVLERWEAEGKTPGKAIE